MLLNISIANVVYTIVNILFLALIFRIFLFKRVDRILEARKEEAEKEQIEAKNASDKANALKQEYEAKTVEQKAERDKILADAREKGYTEYAQIVDNARKEAEALLADAQERARIDAEKEKAKYLENLSDVIVDAASKIAAGQHSEETDHKLYDSFINDAENNQN
ncbi:ATP synthase F0 subunit B [Butyrivibrio sp. NC3005]|jgi:F-type H+-transporting ATPase subunit b|uniref:ATP synthase F0 subunit B n=1 Tax=Butyrivibrio sp. NC3005 TaxID=1280685 RepID=UPI0004235CE1|nr:ATP synthase F0 subunit B [Butyrivibrio sp. NC3005]